MLNKKNLFFLAFFWTLLVTVLSLMKIESLESIGSGIKITNKDKLVHFSFYFFMAILWFRFFSISKISQLKLKVLIATISYGILMEICQGVFTNYRTPDFSDVIANSFGALSGILLMKKVKDSN